MVMHNCRNLVEKVPFLNSAPADFLYDIICKLQFQVYFPGDIVVEAGEFVLIYRYPVLKISLEVDDAVCQLISC